MYHLLPCNSPHEACPEYRFQLKSAIQGSSCHAKEHHRFNCQFGAAVEPRARAGTATRSPDFCAAAEQSVITTSLHTLKLLVSHILCSPILWITHPASQPASVQSCCLLGSGLTYRIRGNKPRHSRPLRISYPFRPTTAGSLGHWEQRRPQKGHGSLPWQVVQSPDTPEVMLQ